MKKSLYVTFVLLAVLGSCNREDNVIAPSMDVELGNYISSESFKSLGIDVSRLDLIHYKKTASKSYNEVLYVPLLGRKDKFVLGFVNEDKSYRSTLVEIESPAKYDELSQKFTNKQLTADFKFSSSESDFKFEIVDSHVFTPKNLDVSQSGRMAACNSMIDVYACAATAIDQMGPFSYAACLIEMPICLAIALADCLYAGCAGPGSPQVPQP